MKYTGQLLVRLVTLGLLSAQRNFWVSDVGQYCFYAGRITKAAISGLIVLPWWVGRANACL